MSFWGSDNVLFLNFSDGYGCMLLKLYPKNNLKKEDKEEEKKKKV